MIVTGFIILFFVVYHILHFTAQVPGVNFTGQDFHTFHLDGAKGHDIYRMMVVGFQQPLVSAFYVLGIGLLCTHLSHGLGSMFQSMGWKTKFYGIYIDRFALVASIVLFIGYCSVPTAILLGLVK